MRPAMFAVLVLVLSCRFGWSEDASATKPVPSPPPHRFWDTTNKVLFAGVAASRALDYASTRHFRARGDNEVLLTNSIVDDEPLFIAIEAAGTALSIGASALLHAHGHHRLERWLSVVHIGVSTFGAVRNYRLEPAHGFAGRRQMTIR